MTLRVALAGAGFASGLHLPGWKRVPNAAVVAICDPNRDKAIARAREFGVEQTFDDVGEMLRRMRPDAIDIASPLSTHTALCRLAADHGVHILCQKPLAPSAAEAEQLARDVDGKVRLMVHENWRFRAQYRHIKRWLDAGDLGTPVFCSMQAHSAGLLSDATGALPQLVRQPFFADLTRLLIGETLIHHLDVLRWLLGSLRVVAARTARRCSSVRGEDHAVILLEGQGCTAVLEGNMMVPGAARGDRFELIGTRGTALFEGDTVQLRNGREESITLDLVSGYGDSYAAAIAHFAASLESGAPFETDARDNLQTLALVDQAYAAAA